MTTPRTQAVEDVMASWQKMVDSVSAAFAAGVGAPVITLPEPQAFPVIMALTQDEADLIRKVRAEAARQQESREPTHLHMYAFVEGDTRAQCACGLSINLEEHRKGTRP